MKLADPLDTFDRAIGEVNGRFYPTTVFHSRSGDKQWFDASYQRAYDAKQTDYHAWCRAHSALPFTRVLHPLMGRTTVPYQ